MSRYTTKRDAIEALIVPALGEFGDDYDINAIADETLAYAVDTDADGNELLNTAGFEQIVADDKFWTIVTKHDQSA
jgi:hypothetical protein